MKPLTLQQAREFIAEKAGWTNFLRVDHTHTRAIPPNDDLRERIPDYFNPEDKEALFWMHKAEQVITEKVQQAAYSEALIQILNRSMDGQFRFLGATPYHIANATAPQRARAFCHVFGFSVEGEG